MFLCCVLKLVCFIQENWCWIRSSFWVLVGSRLKKCMICKKIRIQTCPDLSRPFQTCPDLARLVHWLSRSPGSVQEDNRSPSRKSFSLFKKQVFVSFFPDIHVWEKNRILHVSLFRKPSILGTDMPAVHVHLGLLGNSKKLFERAMIWAE